MKVQSYKIPKSSFMSVDKDLALIIDMMLKNKNLKKLLFYTSRDALSRDPLTEAQSAELIGKNIKIVPKIYVDGSVETYVIITMDNFTTNYSNPQFRNNTINFDIVCHYDQWPLKDFQMRPFRIAAEIDEMFDNKHLTGIGILQFMGAEQITLNDEYGGISLVYQAIHGGEDKKHAPNSNDEQKLVDDFNELYGIVPHE